LGLACGGFPVAHRKFVDLASYKMVVIFHSYGDLPDGDLPNLITMVIFRFAKCKRLPEGNSVTKK
jgi:hypothetical protein